MHGFNLARRGALWLAVIAVAVGFAHQGADGDDGRLSGIGSLADHGERALERLPYKVQVIRANLGKRVPMSVAACYLMQDHLLVVSEVGRVYCLDRRNLEPRWVNTLRYPLAKPPAEGATHFGFLLKDHKGAHWLHAISKRSGTAGERFPVRLPFTASSGVDLNASMAFVGSLGSPGNNKTLETTNLISGRRGWGYNSSGMLWGNPVLDPSGDVVIVAGDDGVVTALTADSTAPSTENWIRDLGGAVRGSVIVTPRHVVAGNDDGILYNLDLFSGRVNWLQGLDEAIRGTPWVLGGMKEIQRSTGVAGASPVTVKEYVGLAFARNVNGLHAFDLTSGKPAFSDAKGGRPLARHGKYLLTINRARGVTIRDASDGYKETGALNFKMFDLVPTNTTDGAVYACTSDGNVLAAIPK